MNKRSLTRRMKAACDVAGAAALVANIALFAACGIDSIEELPDRCARIGHPDFTGPTRGVIGPEGGLVENTETRPYGIPGVRVEVEPGAWQQCWEARVQERSLFDTPDYPDGFEPFGRPHPSGAVDVLIGTTTPPVLEHASPYFERTSTPLPFKLSFPMTNIPVGDVEVGAAFFYDEAQGSWRIVLAQDGDQSDDRLAVRTSAHDKLWSWGRVNLEEVDYEALEPALKERYGTDLFGEIQATIEQIAAQAEALALQQQWQLDCDALNKLDLYLVEVAHEHYTAAALLGSSLGCGQCNPLSSKMWKDAQKYGALDAGINLATLPVSMIRGGGQAARKLIKLGLKSSIKATGHALSDLLDTSCDVYCYLDRKPPEMAKHQYIYYAVAVARAGIALYKANYLDNCGVH